MTNPTSYGEDGLGLGLGATGLGVGGSHQVAVWTDQPPQGRGAVRGVTAVDIGGTIAIAGGWDQLGRRP
jgi:hypothetical protein